MGAKTGEGCENDAVTYVHVAHLDGGKEGGRHHAQWYECTVRFMSLYHDTTVSGVTGDPGICTLFVIARITNIELCYSPLTAAVSKVCKGDPTGAY